MAAGSPPNISKRLALTTGQRQWLALTIAVWSFAFCLFGAAGFIMDGGRWRPWMPLWLMGLTTVGLLLSWLVTRAALALEPLPRWGQWPLLGVAVLSAAALQSGADVALQVALMKALGTEFAGDYGYSLAFNLLVYLWLFGLYIAAIKLQRASRRVRDQQRRLLELKAANDRARLDALRYQLNPHFLFNSLNGVLTLVLSERNAEAAAMVRRLALYLRSSLESDPSDLIPLEAELNALEAYLDIERARFGDRLEVEFACAEGARQALVPALMLQPLLENIMTHVVAHTTAPVAIALDCRLDDGRLHIAVRNDGVSGATSASPGFGIGLQNVRSRLELLFKHEAQVEAGCDGGVYRVEIRHPACFASGDPAIA